MLNNELTILAKAVANISRENHEFFALVVSELQGVIDTSIEPVAETPVVATPAVPAPKGKHAKAKSVESPVEHWFDAFKSANTTVEVKGSTVQVTVGRGHADEWHDALRSAGFKWSRKNRNWWAYLDDEKRAEVATRNVANDAATAGMTKEEKRAYWAARKANHAA